MISELRVSFGMIPIVLLSTIFLCVQTLQRKTIKSLSSNKKDHRAYMNFIHTYVVL